MNRGLGRTVARAIRGVGAALRARPKVFVGVTIGVFVLDLFLPPAVLSLARKPWDFFTFNPWLSRLPEYIASPDIPLRKKLEFLPKLVLFWFSADSPYGGVEWGFAVDGSDLVRFLFMSLLFGAYFALWFYRRDQGARWGWSARTGQSGGVAAVLASLLGFSTGPCTVVGCGAPVIPVVGLAFVGLSSGTLAFLAGLSRVATTVVLVAMTLSVAYLGWLVSGNPPDRRLPQ